MEVVIIKTCSICEENKPLNEYYSQVKKNKNNEQYTYYQPYCKECAKKKSKKWMGENDEQYREKMKVRTIKRGQRPEKKIYQRNWAKEQRSSGYYKKWQNKNKDKVKNYNEQHRNHDIDDSEWKDCKEYFYNECAYCGLHISEHFITYAGELKHTDFHREHVDYDGANDLSNCVPSCRDCNSSKWQYDFEEWYSPENETYDKYRYNKIIKWLKDDYKIYMK